MYTVYKYLRSIPSMFFLLKLYKLNVHQFILMAL